LAIFPIHVCVYSFCLTRSRLLVRFGDAVERSLSRRLGRLRTCGGGQQLHQWQDTLVPDTLMVAAVRRQALQRTRRLRLAGLAGVSVVVLQFLLLEAEGGRGMNLHVAPTAAAQVDERAHTAVASEPGQLCGWLRQQPQSIRRQP
jgi:hypothetical protein